MASTEPPVCVLCVALSLKRCPALHRGAVAVRVRECPIAGVRGAIYQRGLFGPTPVSAANVTYEDPDIRWTVASALIRELKGCALISLEELIAQHAAA
jgi:hypothetical protein